MAGSGPILLVVSLFFTGTVFVAGTFAQKAADRAILQEHEELLALYGQSESPNAPVGTRPAGG
jgi:hypothetical protein